MTTSQVISEHADADTALRVLSSAVALHARDGSGLEHLRMPLREYCTLARREGFGSEQVVIHLKHALADLPVLAIESPTAFDALRARIISFAIEAYYSRDGESNGR
jgi:hypothetical protein